MTERIVILGAGRVGCGLALALRHAGLDVVGVWTRSADRAGRARALLGREVAWGSIDALPAREASLIIIAVADDAVAEVAAAVATLRLTPPIVVCHTAGIYSSDVLPPGLRRASMHPLCACAEPHAAAAALRRAPYVLEGDKVAVDRLADIVRALGGTPLALRGDKQRYHAACVLASNLVVALFEEAVALSPGLENARQVLAALATQALDVAVRSPDHALTGPISRGDVATIDRHLAALPPTALDPYCTLSLQAVAIAERQGLDPKVGAQLRATLSAARARPRNSS